MTGRCSRLDSESAKRKQPEMTKRLSPRAITALQDALSVVFWFKGDLKRFLVAAFGGTELVNRVNWDNNKRQIVSDIVSALVADQERYLGELRLLVREVSEMKDFAHLERLEDGRAKASEARAAVRALSELVADHDALVRAQEQAKQKKQEARAVAGAQRAVIEGLECLRAEFVALVMEADHRKRGFALEKLMYELFRLFDLDPKVSFRITGEQIDGAFSLQGTDYLFEAKWAGRSSAKEMDVFASKIQRKLDNTLGLLLSIDGFEDEGVTAHSKRRPVLLLMTGADLMAVFENRIDFVQLLVRKRRHASQTGRILIEFHQM